MCLPGDISAASWNASAEATMPASSNRRPMRIAPSPLFTVKVTSSPDVLA